MKRTFWLVLLPLILLAQACRPTEGASETTPAATAPVQTAVTVWQCSNDLEIGCADGKCEAGEDFTPMRVQVDDAGAMNVCAYSGCWEGTGTVVRSEHFVVITGHDLTFSTAPDSEDSKEDIAIVIDTADQVAILKAGAFAHPLLCGEEEG